MKLRPAPKAANRFVKVFCSDAEQESVIGDLTEQYQRGHNAIWYWRQVIGIVILGLYRKPQRIPLKQGFALVFVIAVLAAALLSEIAVFALFGILAGVVGGILKFERGKDGTQPDGSDVSGVVRIDSSKIPIGGGLGAGILIVLLLTGVLIDLPRLRLLALPGILTGLVFAAALHLWRKSHVADQSLVTLGLKSDAIGDVKNQLDGESKKIHALESREHIDRRSLDTRRRG